MTAISTAFSTLIQDVSSLEAALGGASSTSGLSSFLSDLEGVLARGEQLLAGPDATSTATTAATSGSTSTSSTGATTSTGSTGSTTTTGPTGSTATIGSTDSTGSTPTSTTNTSSPGVAHLLADGSAPSSNKPGVLEFMTATGTDFATAADVLYGTIGSNTDLRDWPAIMASNNPLADAEASTAALYQSGMSYVNQPTADNPGDVLGKSGNFELVLKQLQPYPAPKSQVLTLVDSQGNELRTVSNQQDLIQNAKTFGFNLSDVMALTKQLEASGILFRTGAWSNGFLPTWWEPGQNPLTS